MPYEVERKVPFPVKIFIPQPYAVEKHRYGGHGHQQQQQHHHHSHHPYDHHSDYSNKYPQQVAATSSSAQQSSQSAEGSSSEFSDYLPKPEHLRVSQNHQQTTKLFSPYQSQNQASASSPQPEERPYNQQHQLHHQQQYVTAQSMRKEMYVRNRMKYNSDEDSDESSEFRPMMGHSMEDGSSAATNNVETVVPAPPSLSSSGSGGSSSSSSPSSVRPFHINVPERLPQAQALTSSTSNSVQHSDAAVSTHNQYQQNIEIPVHVFRLQFQPIEQGQGFAIAS